MKSRPKMTLLSFFRRLPGRVQPSTSSKPFPGMQYLLRSHHTRRSGTGKSRRRKKLTRKQNLRPNERVLAEYVVKLEQEAPGFIIRSGDLAVKAGLPRKNTATVSSLIRLGLIDSLGNGWCQIHGSTGELVKQLEKQVLGGTLTLKDAKAIVLSRTPSELSAACPPAATPATTSGLTPDDVTHALRTALEIVGVRHEKEIRKMHKKTRNLKKRVKKLKKVMKKLPPARSLPDTHELAVDESERKQIVESCLPLARWTNHTC